MTFKIYPNPEPTSYELIPTLLDQASLGLTTEICTRFGGQPNFLLFYFPPCGKLISGASSSTKVTSEGGGGVWLNTR